MTSLNELTLVEASRMLRARECSVREIWDACAAAITQHDPNLHAYLEVFSPDEEALSNAQRMLDEQGVHAPVLCGIPLAIKDNILMKGKIASAASRMLETYKATYDASVIQKLRSQGALFIGRTNMDEFALGGSTENSAFGVTKNPHDTTRVSGGTSGGSAVAVAAHMAIAALGTDTGGSVRNPASYCGVVGCKPTYGSVSRSGIIAAASSFDQVGPLTKTVEDAKLVFEAIAGHDPFDSTSLPTMYEVRNSVPKTFRIGVIRSLLTHPGIDSDTRATFIATIDQLQQTGHEIIDIEIPSADPALAAYYIINFAEVSTNLARYDGMRYGHAERGDSLLDDYIRSRTSGFGSETRRRILLGTYVLSSGYIDAYYHKAVAARAILTREFQAAFERVDIIATPTMPTPAFTIGEKSDPLSLYLEDIFTITANLTGLPALSVPMGTVEREGKRLPVGLQFMASSQAEAVLFAAGQAVEKIVLR